MSEILYCKYGGISPKCSDCKRNHNNSSFKTEEIHNWFEIHPTISDKKCSDYIKK